jgi:Transcriptional regulator
MARRTKADSELTRQQLLDAAEILFSRKGVSNTSLNEIAAAAGVTRGAIYWHFANKVELLDAMQARVALPLEEMELETQQQPNPLAALRDYWIRAILRLMECDQSRRVVDILLRKCEYVQDFECVSVRTQQWQASIMRLMSSAFAEAERKNLLAEDLTPAMAAFSSYSMITGLIYTWLSQPPAVDMHHQVTTVLHRHFASFCRAPAGLESPRRSDL